MKALPRRIGRRPLLIGLAASTVACGREFAPLASSASPRVRRLEASAGVVSEGPPYSLESDRVVVLHWASDRSRRAGVWFRIRGLPGNSRRCSTFLCGPLCDNRNSRGKASSTTRERPPIMARRQPPVWTCAWAGGRCARSEHGFDFNAEMDSHSLSLLLVPTKPPVLHNQIGLLDFSPFGWSYYYSYPRLVVVGDLIVDQYQLRVDGSAWMDHQWGDFINVGSGGWDWFSLQLDDGRDFTASIVRDAGYETVLRYGTLIDQSGDYRHLDESDFSIVINDTWSSPRSSARYPSAWTLRGAVRGAGSEAAAGDCGPGTRCASEHG